MPNISSQLADLSIIRSLIITRVSNGLANKTALAYNDIIKEITNAVRTADSEIVLKNLNSTIKDLQSMVTDNSNILQDDLNKLAISEAAYTVSSTNAIIGAEIMKKLPSEKTLERIYGTSLIEGATITNWFSSMDKSMQVDTERAMRLGVSLGETNHELSKRLSIVLGKTSRQSESLVRTATSTITNQVRMEVYSENEDIFSGWEHLSVLDSRTSLICSPRDGATWDLEHKGINSLGKRFKYQVPPLHFQCRSILNPILKSWEELDMPELSELPQSTRASMDGSVSSGTNFNSWLKSKDAKFQKKYLGIGRYELYRDGKISLSDLVNRQGKTITIEELNQKFN